MAEEKTGPHPVDIHVGGRVKLKRTMLGLSQENLGDRLGVTFQQVQKYEKGSNRISASRLLEVATILETSVSFFFEGLPSVEDQAEAGFAETGSSDFVTNFLGTSEGLQLNRAFMKVKDPKVRRKIIDLVTSLSSED